MYFNKGLIGWLLVGVGWGGNGVELVVWLWLIGWCGVS